MKRRISRAWLQETPQDQTAVEAKELDYLMDEMQDELQSFRNYIRLFEKTCKYRYSRHGRLRKFLREIQEELRLSSLTLSKLQETYESKIAEHEHLFGTVTCKPPRHFADFSVSIHELLDEQSEDEMLWRFFNE